MRPIGDLPANCRDWIDGEPVDGIYTSRSTVWAEHCDRIKRLMAISAQLPPNQRPDFYDGTILARDLPGIGYDMPVLRVVFPDRSFFKTNQTQVKEEAIPVARIIAENLRDEPPDVAMFVAGHADARGERAYNAALSIDRANALAAEILFFGAGYASVWRVGFGEDLPLVSGDSQDAHDQNRRIEFLFAGQPAALGVWMSRNQKDNLCKGRTAQETAGCRKGLLFARSYDVVEVRREARVTVKGLGGGRASTSARARGETKVAVAAPVTTTVATTAGGGQTINLSRGKLITLDLSRGQSK